MRLTKKSDDETLAVVTPIMDKLMQASTEIDHAKHVRDFPLRLPARVNTIAAGLFD